MKNPPHWAERFLRWYCNPDLLEEIEGDIYELFDRRVDERGIRFAKRRFIWDTIRFCRWSNIKRTKSINQRSNSISMLFNYIKSGIRNMARYWVTTSINILGLALALGTLITIFMFIDIFRNIDNYHTKADRIFQVISNINSEDNLELWGDSPIKLGEALLENQSQVEDIFRLEQKTAAVKYNDKVFSETLAFTDPGFFNMLDYKLLAGDPTTLSKRDHIVISYYMAEKYFDLEDPVGKLLTIKFGAGNIKTFTVGAVLDKYSYNTSMRFNFLIPMVLFEELYPDKKLDWAYFTDATFVLLKDPKASKDLTDQLSQYVDIQNSYDPEWKIETFSLMPLPALATESYTIRNAVSGGTHPAGQITLGIIGILLTILACLNYMNISIAASTKRLKEIAMRKVLGSTRLAITFQFLTENILQIVLALIIGYALGYFLLMPGLNNLLPFSLPFQFTSLFSTLIFFVGVLMGVGVLSSLYPALYVSRFQPVSIFKGNTRFGSRNIFSKILLTFQLTFAFITVVGCFIFTDNAIRQKNEAWGYDGQDMLSVALTDNSQYQTLKEYADSNPLVADFVGSGSQLTLDYNIQMINQLETEIKTAIFDISPNFPQVMNMKLAEGNWINSNLEAANNTEILVNEAFVRKMNWDNPIGQKLTLDDKKLTIVGVLEDFQYQVWFAYQGLLPTLLRVVPMENYNYGIFKSTAGNLHQLDAEMKAKWLEIAPNDPYDRLIQANAYDPLFIELQGNIIGISFISVIAIILAALGLFGLLSFNIQARLKEFSVRKILGASARQLVKVASKQYYWVVGIGFAVGAPLGYVLMNSLIQSIFPNPKPTGVFPFILAITIMVIALALTIIGQLLKAIRVNPAENLRNE